MALAQRGAWIGDGQSYEALKRPRWQKKRLKVFERAGWACERCGDVKEELHVHHGFYYDKFRAPWEYPIESLKCLCKICHEAKHDEDKILESRTDWYQNGQKKAEGNYKDGERHGLRTNWYENGQKREERKYKNGKLWTAVAWKPDGVKCPETNVKDGNGIIVVYKEDGTGEKGRANYVDGENTYYVDLTDPVEAFDYYKSLRRSQGCIATPPSGSSPNP